MPLEIQPKETAVMIYYVMSLHSELALLLLERMSLSLRSLFEDAQEVEENIHVSRNIQEHIDFEDLHAQEKKYYQYISDSEQESSEYEIDMEQ